MQHPTTPLKPSSWPAVVVTVLMGLVTLAPPTMAEHLNLRRGLQGVSPAASVACSTPSTLPTSIQDVPECKQAMDAKPDFQARTETSMQSWAGQMCTDRCATGWNNYTQSMASQIKTCNRPSRMLLQSFEDFLLMKGDKQQQEGATAAEGNDDKKNTASFPGWVLGCMKDPGDDKYCAAKAMDHTKGQCDFVSSCCFGEYIKATGLKPDGFDMYHLKSKCPQAEAKMTSTCQKN